MQNYEKKYLKNIFAEHNMANVDYYGNPEELISSLGGTGLRSNKAAAIKHAIMKDSRLMACDYISQSVANRPQYNHSRSSESVPGSPFKGKMDLESTHKREIIEEVLSNQISSSNLNLEKRTLEDLKKIDSKSSMKVGTLSKVLEHNEQKEAENRTAEGERPMSSQVTKYRNIFSATTNANSQGLKLKTRIRINEQNI